MRMAGLPRLADLNPLKLFAPMSSKIAYERLPSAGNPNGQEAGSSPFESLKKYRWRSPGPGNNRFRLFSPYRFLIVAVTAILCLALIGGGGFTRRSLGHTDSDDDGNDSHGPAFVWQNFPRLNGYYNGVRKLGSFSEWIPENPLNETAEIAQEVLQRRRTKESEQPTMKPIKFNPYPDYDSPEYIQQHRHVEKCYLDKNDKIAPPDVMVYPGIPEGMTAPFFGSYEELGLAHDVCFDRIGRYGPYGYAYSKSEGGLGLGDKSESAGKEEVFNTIGKVDYRYMDWGAAQKRCHEKNRHRFYDDKDTDLKSQNGDKTLKKVPRHAYVLRTWTGNKYDDHQMAALRAMITELNLKTSGEYDVHFLVHVKDNSIPIWASEEVYRETLEENVPEEFWGMATLWSEKLMELYYPDPFPDNVVNMAGQPIHGVYRSAHFALQWFAQQHQEYDFFWNWEMDVRFNGHYYEFHNRVGEWAKQQPRKGLWERSGHFYVPSVHGAWANYTYTIEEETFSKGEMPVWGPVEFEASDMLEPPKESYPNVSYFSDDYEWGVGEDADLIVFDPLFDPERSNWVFRLDVTGYNLSLSVPPRRCAIITIGRISRKLLNIMHEETWAMRHTMFPEMWPPSVALHHGLKAAYAPHPVFFDRDWPVEYINQVFNHPASDFDSPFGWGEHNFLGSSFYYNSGFSGALWRRWLGQRENSEGGATEEKTGSGRMCLRSTLFHPIKHERSPED